LPSRVGDLLNERNVLAYKVSEGLRECLSCDGELFRNFGKLVEVLHFLIRSRTEITFDHHGRCHVLEIPTKGEGIKLTGTVSLLSSGRCYWSHYSAKSAKSGAIGTGTR
jgi:hypothetical protein